MLSLILIKFSFILEHICEMLLYLWHLTSAAFTPQSLVFWFGFFSRREKPSCTKNTSGQSETITFSPLIQQMCQLWEQNTRTHTQNVSFCDMMGLCALPWHLNNSAWKQGVFSPTKHGGLDAEMFFHQLQTFAAAKPYRCPHPVVRILSSLDGESWANAP